MDQRSLKRSLSKIPRLKEHLTTLFSVIRKYRSGKSKLLLDALNTAEKAKSLLSNSSTRMTQYLQPLIDHFFENYANISDLNNNELHPMRNLDFVRCLLIARTVLNIAADHIGPGQSMNVDKNVYHNISGLDSVFRNSESTKFETVFINPISPGGHMPP